MGDSSRVLSGQREVELSRSGEAIDDEVLEDAIRRVGEDRYVAGNTELRAPGPTAMLLSCYVLLACLPLIPGADRILGELTFRQAACCLFPGAAAAIAVALSFRFVGPLAKLTFGLDHVESLANVSAVSGLIYFSGSAATVLWIFMLVMALFFANHYTITHRWDGAALGVGIGGLAIAFWLSNKPADGWLSAVAALTLLVIHGALVNTNRATHRLQVERDLLQDKLRGLAVENERQRIARDLHDGLGAEITALLYELQRVDADEDEPAAARARQALAELRVVVAGLKRRPCSLGALAREIEARCAASAGDAVLSVELSGDTDRALPGDVQEASLRVTQELVRNAMTHGRAAKVVVTITAEANGDVLLDVADDGCGLDAHTFRGALGGLTHARERAAALGGTVERLDTDHGTRIRITLPA